MTIPIIDISPLRSLTNATSPSPSIASTVNQIANACQTYGFFAITHHGVPPSLISAVWDVSSSFFDLETSVKKEVGMSEDYPYGYENYESLEIERANATDDTTVANGAAISNIIDTKETFSIGPSHSQSKMPRRRFPSNRPSFERTLTEYYTAMESLAQTLFRGLALALNLDTDWFLQKDVFDLSSHQCALRILNYPSLEYNGGKTVIRAGAHTDYGAMTLLLSGGPGLQLRLSAEDEEEWIDVPYLEGAFVVNLGDLMQRWTNDRWRSTLHRVVAVPDSAVSEVNRDGLVRSGRRQSVAFFVNMNGEANVEPFESCFDENNPVRYEAIRASDHLMQRHLQSIGMKS